MKIKFIILALLVLGPLGCADPSSPSTVQPGESSQAIAEQNTAQLSPKTVGGVNLVPAKPIPGLEMLLPEGFTEMDAATLATKYPGENRPTLVFTNETGAINIAINHTQNQVAPNQLTQLHQQLDSSVRQAQPQATWMFSGFQHYHGKKWIQLEFQSAAIDTKVHNMMISTSADGRMLAVSFNCTDEHAAKWLEIGREIIKSVHVSG